MVKTRIEPFVSSPRDVSTDYNIGQWDKVILRVYEVSNEGFMVGQPSKSVTKPKF